MITRVPRLIKLIFLGLTELCRFICLLQEMFGPMFSIIDRASIIGPEFRIVSK